MPFRCAAWQPVTGTLNALRSAKDEKHMGSIVSLGIGNLEIDWGKNNHFINHSRLFNPSDQKVINYHTYEGVTYEQTGFSSPLSKVKLRLDLLGYSLSDVKRIYEECLKDYPDYYPEFNLSFKDFAKVISSIDIDKIELSGDYPNYDLGEYASKVILSQSEFGGLRDHVNTQDNDIGTFFENLDPYVQLRLLAENPKNHSLLLEWRTHDIVEGGWVKEGELFEELKDSLKFLIVTEGSSDAFIIKRAIELIRPDIADFFTFVDMEEHYPFSGTGNLYKFFQGLVSIRMLNKCLFIFDNDAEGIEKYEKAKIIDAPANLRVAKLPDLEEFSSFLTVGPNGEQKANVNGKAVAIECFLDLSYKTKNIPIIRWSSYKSSLDVYQGALEEKEFYTKQFKKVTSLEDGYDFGKLKLLVEHIVESCI